MVARVAPTHTVRVRVLGGVQCLNSLAKNDLLWYRSQVTRIATVPTNWLPLEERKLSKPVMDVLLKRVEEVLGRVPTDEEITTKMKKVFHPATLVYMYDGQPVADLQFHVDHTAVNEISVDFLPR
jgi:hypothetical protein